LGSIEEGKLADFIIIDQNIFEIPIETLYQTKVLNTIVNGKARKIVAQRIIEAGEDITFNYLTSERQITTPFDCQCSDENCVGRIE
jgi:dihydroorotase-like cyclic amidohydrolase